MFIRKKTLSIVLCLVTVFATLSATAMASGSDKKSLEIRPDRGRTTALIADEVRHQLVTLPYYGVFDWLEAQILPDDTVVLRGQVTQPITKSDAEARVRSLESVAKVVNQIEVLPLSSSDGIRMRNATTAKS